MKLSNYCQTIMLVLNGFYVFNVLSASILTWHILEIQNQELILISVCNYSIFISINKKYYKFRLLFRPQDDLVASLQTVNLHFIHCYLPYHITDSYSSQKADPLSVTCMLSIPILHDQLRGSQILAVALLNKQGN
jgi:hypothetical protein